MLITAKIGSVEGIGEHHHIEGAKRRDDKAEVKREGDRFLFGVGQVFWAVA